MTALAMDVRELSFDEVEDVAGGPIVDRASIADEVRDIADFVRGLIDGFKD